MSKRNYLILLTVSWVACSLNPGDVTWWEALALLVALRVLAPKRDRSRAGA